MTQFTDFGLAAGLLSALRTEGYENPTPIQAQAIPPILEGRDILGVAQTGTGKTAAFALPILHRLAANRRPAGRRACRVLVLSPTRELAQQIAESFRTYGSKMGVSAAVFVGGVKYGGQMRSVAGGVDVLVATPGRLIDHLGQGTVRLDETEVFVLDEADQMLDLGFLEPIRKIIRKLPHARQNLFFSATMPGAIGVLAGEILKDPAEVRVTPQATTVERVSQRVIHIEADRKRSLLVDLLAPRDVSRALVFTRTKRGADRLAKYIDDAGIVSAAIHGDKSQGQRERALASFKAGKVKVLIATDIAARGIDIDAVSHVFNYELPNVPEAYVHRIGRTARAGAEGAAITLCDRSELGLLKDIERLTRLSIPAEDMRADQSRPVRPAEGGQGGGKKQHRRGGRGPRPDFNAGAPREHAPRTHNPAAAPRDHAHARGPSPAGAPRERNRDHDQGRAEALRDRPMPAPRPAREQGHAQQGGHAHGRPSGPRDHGQGQGHVPAGAAPPKRQGGRQDNGQNRAQSGRRDWQPGL